MMTNQLVNFEIAILAKEVGFNIKSNYFFNSISGNKIHSDNIFRSCEGTITECPTKSELHQWIIDNYKLYVIIVETFTMALKTNIGFYAKIIYPDQVSNDNIIISYFSEWFFSTYNEAMNDGLLNVLKLIKDGKD